VPVITAAQAIRLALDTLGARTIALVSPYPAALAEAGYRYWEGCGIRVAGRLRVDPDLSDTHDIYELTCDDSLRALREVERAGADCLVASGTGMPTLRALRTLREEIRMPIISSNLCLSWALLRQVAPELAPSTPPGLLG
jgi:maleate isomerase